MSKDENRLNFRMKPETAEKLEHWYKADHCRSRNEYAHTCEECEEKLKVLIMEMKTELAEQRRQKAEGKLQPQAPEGKKKGRKKAKKT